MSASGWVEMRQSECEGSKGPRFRESTVDRHVNGGLYALFGNLNEERLRSRDPVKMVEEFLCFIHDRIRSFIHTDSRRFLSTTRKSSCRRVTSTRTTLTR